MSVPTFSSSYDLLTQKLRIEFTHAGTSVDIYGAFTADGKTAIGEGNFAHADVFAIAAEIPSTETYYEHQFVGADADLGWPTAGRPSTTYPDYDLSVAVADHATPTDYAVSFLYYYTPVLNLDAGRIYGAHRIAERIQIPANQTSLKHVRYSLTVPGISGATVGANLKLTILEWDTDYATTLLYSEPIAVEVIPEFKIGLTSTFRFQDPVAVTPGGEYLFVLELDDSTKGSYNICYAVIVGDTNSTASGSLSVTVTGVNAEGATTVNMTNNGGSDVHFDHGSRIQIGATDNIYTIESDVDITASGSADVVLLNGLVEATTGGETVAGRDEYYLDGTLITDRRIYAAFQNDDRIYLPPKSDIVVLVDLQNFSETLTIDPVTNQHGMPFATRNTRVLTRSDGRTLGGRLTTTIHNHKQRFQIAIKMTSQAVAEDLMEWWERREFYICFMPRTEAANRFGSIKQVRWIEGPPEFANVGNKQVLGYHDVEMVLEEV